MFGARDPVAKQLELYRAPRAAAASRAHARRPDRPGDAAAPAAVPERRGAAATTARAGQPEGVDAQDLEARLPLAPPGEVDGAFILSPSLRLNFSARRSGSPARRELPVQAHRKEWVEQGALFSFGVDLAPVGRAGGALRRQHPQGQPPADLPAEEVPKSSSRSASRPRSRLGIKVPQDMIIQADVVYR